MYAVLHCCLVVITTIADFKMLLYAMLLKKVICILMWCDAWFRSYILGRTQIVHYGSTVTESVSVRSGPLFPHSGTTFLHPTHGKYFTVGWKTRTRGLPIRRWRSTLCLGKYSIAVGLANRTLQTIGAIQTWSHQIDFALTLSRLSSSSWVHFNSLPNVMCSILQQLSHLATQWAILVSMSTRS